MNFLTRLRQRKAQQTETATERYRSLVAKAAKNGGDLADDDAKALERLCDLQAIPLERVEADIAALTRAAELEAQIAAAGDVEAAKQRARKAAADYQSESNRLTAERTARQVELDKAAARATAAVGERQRLRDELTALQRQHHALMGAEDPAVADRRKYLVRGIDGARNDDRTCVFESIIHNPENVRIDDVDFVLADGQDADDFAYMAAAVRAACAGGLRNPRYLISRDDKLPALAYPYKDWFVRFIEDEEQAGSNPHHFTFLRHPNQSQAELDGLLERWRTAYAKTTGQR